MGVVKVGMLMGKKMVWMVVVEKTGVVWEEFHSHDAGSDIQDLV